MNDASTKPRCYLLELPPELRLLIYEHLWTNLQSAGATIAGGYYILSPTHPMQLRRSGITPINSFTLALLASCKIIRTEAHPVAYRLIHFQIELNTYINGLGSLRTRDRKRSPFPPHPLEACTRTRAM